MRMLLLGLVLAVAACTKEEPVIKVQAPVTQAVTVLEPVAEIKKCTNPKFKVGQVVTTVLDDYKGLVNIVYEEVDAVNNVCWYEVIMSLQDSYDRQSVDYREFELK
jgi:hypothetical protein